jgi:hypothetical protein
MLIYVVFKVHLRDSADISKYITKNPLWPTEQKVQKPFPSTVPRLARLNIQHGKPQTVISSITQPIFLLALFQHPPTRAKDRISHQLNTFYTHHQNRSINQSV